MFERIVSLHVLVFRISPTLCARLFAHIKFMGRKGIDEREWN